MAAVGRVLLWTVALVAPGGFLLLPVLAAQAVRARRAASEKRLGASQNELVSAR